jgi:uridine kinase
VDRSSVITRATPDAVLIIDGVFAFSPEISEDRNFRIWLDVPPETSAYLSPILLRNLLIDFR